MNGFGLYLRFASAALRAKMQYKVDFVVSSLVYGALTAVDFVLVAAILSRFPTVAGWGVYEIGVLYGIVWIAVSLYRTFAPEVHQFERYIVEGEFDSLLVRPWPTLFTLLARDIEPHRLGGALQGGIILGISCAKLWEAGALDGGELAYVALLSVTGALIPFSLGIATAAVAFWTVRTGDLLTFTMYAPTTASQYPLTIYPRWLKGLLVSVLPVGFINFIPVSYLLEKGGSPLSLWLTPFVSAAAAFLAYALWRAGERRYHSTGS